MVIKNLCILVLCTKVALALEGLSTNILDIPQFQHEIFRKTLEHNVSGNLLYRLEHWQLSAFKVTAESDHLFLSLVTFTSLL